MRRTSSQSQSLLNEQLCMAAWCGAADWVKRLLSEGADVDCYDDTGQTPLHLAVGELRYSATKVLIGAGADVNRTDRAGEWTPLTRSVEARSWLKCLGYKPSTSVLRLLLKTGANQRKRIAKGHTAMQLAKRYKDREAAAVLAAT